MPPNYLDSLLVRRGCPKKAGIGRGTSHSAMAPLESLENPWRLNVREGLTSEKHNFFPELL